MPHVSLKQLESILEGRLTKPAFGLPCRWNEQFGVSIDTRTLQPGELFFAIHGQQHNGHAFLPEAIRNGASGVIIDEDLNYSLTVPSLKVSDTTEALQKLARWHRQQFDALVVGITGTAGKTTTREALHYLLDSQHQGIRSPQNYNNQWGVPLSLLTLDASHEYALIEMGAGQPGDIAQACQWAAPEVGILTSIGPAHLDGLINLHGVLSTKAELLDQLPKGGFAVLPFSPEYRDDLKSHANCRIVTVGADASDDYFIRPQMRTATHQVCLVNQVPFPLPFASEVLASCCFQAVAVCSELGMPLDQLSQKLKDFTPLAGRGAVISVGPWQLIDESYNANPISMGAALNTLACHVGSSSTIAVLGDMAELGSLSSHWHQKIGQLVANRSIDFLAAYGSHSKDVASGAISAGMPVGQVVASTDFEVIVSVVQCWLQENSTVMIKGSRLTQMERLIPSLKLWAKEQTPKPASLPRAA